MTGYSTYSVSLADNSTNSTSSAYALPARSVPLKGCLKQGDSTPSRIVSPQPHSPVTPLRSCMKGSRARSAFSPRRTTTNDGTVGRRPEEYRQTNSVWVDHKNRPRSYSPVAGEATYRDMDLLSILPHVDLAPSSVYTANSEQSLEVNSNNTGRELPHDLAARHIRTQQRKHREVTVLRPFTGSIRSNHDKLAAELRVAAPLPFFDDDDDDDDDMFSIFSWSAISEDGHSLSSRRSGNTHQSRTTQFTKFSLPPSEDRSLHSFPSLRTTPPHAQITEETNGCSVESDQKEDKSRKTRKEDKKSSKKREKKQLQNKRNTSGKERNKRKKKKKEDEFSLSPWEAIDASCEKHILTIHSACPPVVEDGKTQEEKIRKKKKKSRGKEEKKRSRSRT